VNTKGVSIIIPNYNGRELLGKNIPYVVKAQQNSKNKISEIIVVDDASKDDSVNFLRKSYSQINIIKHKVNRGFPTSVNTGARMAKGEFLALLNTDVIPSRDFLVNILPLFKDEKVFAVSLHERGYGYSIGKFENGFVVHEPGEESEETHETFWVNGGSGIFRREFWMKLGGFDDKLFSPFYWEDTDISYRARKRGYKLLWEPKSNVVHEHESTTGKISKRYREKIQERNQLIFIWKNLTSKYLFRKHIIGLMRHILKHPGYLIIVLMTLSKLGVISKARKKEKRESKVSDEAIFAK
jgi:GT2 family glycosyltransferase